MWTTPAALMQLGASASARPAPGPVVVERVQVAATAVQRRPAEPPGRGHLLQLGGVDIANLLVIIDFCRCSTSPGRLAMSLALDATCRLPCFSSAINVVLFDQLAETVSIHGLQAQCPQRPWRGPIPTIFQLLLVESLAGADVPAVASGRPQPICSPPAR